MQVSADLLPPFHAEMDPKKTQDAVRWDSTHVRQLRKGHHEEAMEELGVCLGRQARHRERIS